jgi:hypothetical protein
MNTRIARRTLICMAILVVVAIAWAAIGLPR